MPKTHSHWRWWLPLAAVIAAPPATAAAATPTGSDFEVSYLRSDGTPMDEVDRLTYANRARCECGDPIEASVYLPPGDWDLVRVRTFVGNRCDEDLPASPCGVVFDAFADFFSDAPRKRFEPLWLAARPSEPGSGPGMGNPAGDCSAGAGEAGVWICVEDGTQTDCQPEEFHAPGTLLSYDFEPPSVAVDELWLEEEDGEMVARWSVDADPSVAGFQLLCADSVGNPISSIGASGPSRGAYSTAADLCSDAEPTDIESLRWAYRCSETLLANAREGRVLGLPADTEVEVLLVAYDRAGNPVAASEVELGRSPSGAGDTDGAQAGGELSGRGCGCAAGERTPLGPLLILLGGLAARTMSRRKS